MLLSPPLAESLKNSRSYSRTMKKACARITLHPTFLYLYYKLNNFINYRATYNLIGLFDYYILLFLIVQKS